MGELMSYSFDVETLTVWSPALRVGEIYVAYVRGLEAAYGKSSGISSIAEDMAEIEPKTFLVFVQDIASVLASSSHAILELELRAVVIPAVVMLERAGLKVTLSGRDDLINEAHSFSASMPS